MRRLTFLRTGQWVTIEPTPVAVRDLLVPLLTFRVQQQKRGKAAYVARKNHLPCVVSQLVEAYVDDYKGRLTFLFGFAERMASVLRAHGYTVALHNLTPPPRPEIFAPRWDRVFDGDTSLWPRQDELLCKVACHENGRFDCPTGWGKSRMLALIARMWPGARLAVVSDTVTVVLERIYPELAQMLPDVGVVGGGRRSRGHRVTCYTADSLHWLLADCRDYGNVDVVLVDESHQAASDRYAYMLAQLPGQPRLYGFSATQDMRWDGKDFRCEGLLGPVRMVVSYDEARRDDIVVPMEVIVRKVVMDRDPCGDHEDEEKLRHGIWCNDRRNDLLLLDAVAYAARGWQTMISCQVLEHVLNIKRRFALLQEKGRIPAGLELACVYRQHDNQSDYQDTLKKMSRRGVGDVFRRLPYMDLERRRQLTRQVERGHIKLFVGTTILNVGFDPKDMRVVCRADCTSSRIADTQVPGRNARHAAGKTVGIVRDYWDKFNRGLSIRFQSRLRSYRRLGWKIKLVAGAAPARKDRPRGESHG